MQTFTLTKNFVRTFDIPGFSNVSPQRSHLWSLKTCTASFTNSYNTVNLKTSFQYQRDAFFSLFTIAFLMLISIFMIFFCSLCGLRVYLRSYHSVKLLEKKSTSSCICKKSLSNQTLPLLEVVLTDPTSSVIRRSYSKPRLFRYWKKLHDSTLAKSFYLVQNNLLVLQRHLQLQY